MNIRDLIGSMYHSFNNRTYSDRESLVLCSEFLNHNFSLLKIRLLRCIPEPIEFKHLQNTQQYEI